MNLHSERTKIAAKLAAIFLLGAVTGSLLTMRIGNRPPDVGQAWAHRTLEDYRTALGLTDHQIEVLRPEFIKAGREMKALRAATVSQLRGVVRKLKGRVEAELTPEQRARFRGPEDGT